jgi:serine/threonine protein kinase
MEDTEHFFSENFQLIEKGLLVKQVTEEMNKKKWKMNNEIVKVIKLNEKNIIEIVEKRCHILTTMSKINSPNIQRIYGYSKNKKGHIYLVFEVIQGKMLREQIHYMDENTKLLTLIKISEIIKDVHSKSLYFNELKMSNIFIYPDNIIKIKYITRFKRDYINSVFMKKYNSKEDKIFYESPDPYDDYVLEDVALLNQRRCVWAFGCLVSEVISYIIPWNQIFCNSLHIESLLIDKSPFAYPDIFLEEKYEKYRNLIEKCTEIDGESRILIDEVYEFLNEMKSD